MTDIYVFGVFIVSSFMQTATGFGYAIITAPLLALVLAPKETVILTMLTGLIIRLMMMGVTKNNGSFKAILPLITASLAGAIPGAYVLSTISNDSLKIFIAVILILATLALWKDYRIKIARNKAVEFIVGGVSGFLGTSTAINGPPVILYYLNAGADENKEVFRGNLTRYFLLINIISILLLYLNGTIKIDEIWFKTAMSVPALAIGFFLGERLFRKLNAEFFRKISLILVLISSLVIIMTTVK